MPSSGPDLIQRTAERLQKAPATAQSLIERAAARELTARAAPFAATKNEPVDGARAPRQRLQTLNTASLAANGIAMPGAGISRTVQEFRAIKRHVLANSQLARPGAANGRVVMVTSAKPRDGKTFTAINLAFALAYEKDTRVLILDADAHHQSLLEYLGISADAGWIDLVSAKSISARDHVIHTNVPNLEILPAGKKRPEIPELMSSRYMKGLLEDLLHQDSDRYIIMDAVACLTSTEPTILAGLAAQTLFVVAAHRTTKDEIDTSLRLLQASPNLNLVLNRADPKLTEQFNSDEYANDQRR